MALTTYTAGEVLTAASLNNNFTFAATNPPGGLAFVTGGAFTAATTVSLANDSFTATFRNYRILFDYTAINTRITIRFRASGTDDSAPNYNFFNLAPTNKTVSGDNQFILNDSSDTAGRHFASSIDVFAPKVAARTNATYHGFDAPAAFNVLQASTGHCSFNANTQFDSLTFISSSAGAITGNFRVYGYSDS